MQTSSQLEDFVCPAASSVDLKFGKIFLCKVDSSIFSGIRSKSSQSKFIYILQYDIYSTTMHKVIRDNFVSDVTVIFVYVRLSFESLYLSRV